MREVTFALSDLEVIRDGDRFFVRYDAGAHQVVMREDEISEADARRIQSGKQEMVEVLHSLQQRLVACGVDPYVSNC
jgi:hypothetical protein